MRVPLRDLSGQYFDVAVIGAGINGCSVAQHLSAAGYRVILVDKGDFAAGASGRSSRVLHCGLRYLAPGSSAWEFVRDPRKFATACRMARQAMVARHEFVTSTPERSRATTFFYPVFRDGTYPAWQVRLAFRFLERLGPRPGPRDVPLGTTYLGRKEIASEPILNLLRNSDDITGVVSFQEYMFDWPERICVDSALDAAHLGATVRNYTPVVGLERDDQASCWRLTLGDACGEAGSAEIGATIVLNMAGVWIDRVNALAHTDVPRKVFGTKGANILVRLPPGCEGKGLAGLNRDHEPLYARPWRDLHYIGPTETVFEGDPDAVRATEADIDFLLGEANYMLPAVNLKREDVLYTWAGIRPLTYDPAYAKGKRSRDIHDMTAAGMPNVFAVTGGPVMTHRSTAIELVERIRDRCPPSREPQPLSYRGRAFPGAGSPEVAPGVTMQDLVVSARDEQVQSLVDLMFRRVGLGWSESMGRDVAGLAAEAVKDILGWSPERVRSEILHYEEYLNAVHGRGGDARGAGAADLSRARVA